MASQLDEVILNLNKIIDSKNEHISIHEIMADIGLDTGDEILRELTTIAYYNADDSEKAKIEMEKYYKNASVKKTLQIQNKEATIIDNLRFILWLKNDTAIQKLQQIDKYDDFIEMFAKIVREKTLIVATNGKLKVFDILPIDSFKDEFGSWSFDPLCDQMKILAEMKDGNCFPEYWKLSQNAHIVFNIESYNSYVYNSEEDLESNMPLEKFVEGVTGRHDIVERLKQLFINNIDDLKRLDEAGWTLVHSIIPAHNEKLRNAVNALQNKNKSIKKNDTVPSPAETLHKWHKCLKSLHYYSDSNYDQLGSLCKEALASGFEEQRNNQEFDIGPVLQKIEVALVNYTIPENLKKMRNKSHGMIFYGPPGTGKTQLSEVIIKKSGLEPVVHSLSSAELNRSLVGGTEKLLMALWSRAKRCPQWLCCIAIDEIDALVPKRNDKASGHKVDALSLLLSLIGGIKDVPNIYVIASTNRLNKIDEAFARRLQDKFYIGKLTNKQRIDLLKQMSKPEAELSGHVKINFSKLEDLMAKLTTNFSGAALSSLRSRILIYFDLNRTNKRINELTEEKLIEVAIKVAHDFQIRLGRYSIPQLIQDSRENNLKELWMMAKTRIMELSGRILIDLRPNRALIGFEMTGSKELLEINLKKNFPNVTYVSDLIPFILDFCIQFNVDNIQLIDTDALVSASAFDEAAIGELINEALEEFDKFDNGLIFFDADTLIGVPESQSGTNESNSYSVKNQQLWQNLLHAFKRSFYNSDKTRRKWCIFISGSDFLIKQFQNLTNFPKVLVDIEIENEDNIKKKQERKCLNCDCDYVEIENNLNSCAYHSGALIKITDDERIALSQNDFMNLIRGVNDHDELEKLKKDYIFLCCTNQGLSPGCTKNKHSDEKMFKYVPVEIPPIFYRRNRLLS